MSVLFAIADGTQGQSEWFISDRNGIIEEYGNGLPPSGGYERVVLIIRGEDVLSRKVLSSARNERDLKDSLLYQLEDEIGVPVEGLHIVAGTKESGEAARWVDLCNAELMEASIAVLKQIGGPFLDAMIVTDASLIPDEAQCVILDGPDRIGLRLADRRFAIDPNMGAELLPALLEEFSVQSARQIRLGGSDRLANTPHAARITETQDFETEADFFSYAVRQGGELNLRDGRFAAKKSLSFDWGVWKATAAIAASVMLLWTGFLAIANWRLDAKTSDLYAASQEAYSDVFPDERVPTNPLSRVRSKSAESGLTSGGADFSRLTAQLYAALQDVEGAELVSLAYSAEAARLSVSLKFSSYEDRDKLKQVVDQTGLQLDLGGSRQNGNVIIGDAIVGMGS